MLKLARFLLINCFIACSLFLTACGGQTPAATPTPSVTPVSIQLSWVHTIEFSGFQIAEREKFYEAHGLDVTLWPAFNAEDEFVPSIPAVLAGEVDFGVASSYDLMRARAEGQPVVAIGAIYQRSPIGVISLEKTGIITPQDLVGKRVTVSGAVGVYFKALLKNMGINEEDVNIIDRNTFSFEPLVDGEIDAYGVYITNQPSVFTRLGIDYNLLVLADYAVDGYTNVIFTTEETIANRPELIKGFLQATFEGYQIALDDPERAATLSLEYNPELIYEDELANMRVSIPLLHPSGSEIGMMRPELWQLGFKIMSEAGQLPEDFDVTKVFNLSFVNEIYGQ